MKGEKNTGRKEGIDAEKMELSPWYRVKHNNSCISAFLCKQAAEAFLEANFPSY